MNFLYLFRFLYSLRFSPVAFTPVRIHTTDQPQPIANVAETFSKDEYDRSNSIDVSRNALEAELEVSYILFHPFCFILTFASGTHSYRLLSNPHTTTTQPFR